MNDRVIEDFHIYFQNQDMILFLLERASMTPQKTRVPGIVLYKH